MLEVCSLSNFPLFYFQTVDILNNPTQPHRDSCFTGGAIYMYVPPCYPILPCGCSTFPVTSKPHHSFITLTSTSPHPLTPTILSAVTHLIIFMGCGATNVLLICCLEWQPTLCMMQLNWFLMWERHATENYKNIFGSVEKIVLKWHKNVPTFLLPREPHISRMKFRQY